MKKLILILIVVAIIASSYGLIAKKQTKTTTNQTITIEDFIGKWKVEYIHNPEDLTDNLINYRFELILEKDSIAENALKGWHCSVVRGGRQMDCVDREYGEEPSLHGYLINDTVSLHFVSSFGGEGEAKLYFDKSVQNISDIIWELTKYEYQIEDFMPRKDTLQNVNK